MVFFQSSNVRFFRFQQINNNHGQPIRTHRISNAVPISVKDVFDVNGGPNSQIYGVSGSVGQINQAYEPVVDDDDRNSINLRLAPRNHQTPWTGSGGNSSAKL